MSNEQKLRDEFEESFPPFDSGDGPLEPGTSNALYSGMFGVWKAAHAFYAPRWLPIDEAAKDGYRKLLGSREPNGRIRIIGVGVWELPDLPNEDDFWLPLIPGSFLIKPTHYMPIPDAPEVE